MRRKGLRRALFSLVVLFGVVFCAEFGVQVLFRLKYGESPRKFGSRAFQRVERYMPDHPYLPYIATKGRAYVNRETWGTTAPVEFNSLGDRGPEPDVPKRRVRFVAFGGSTTFGARSRVHETWPGQLETRLGSDEHEVINAAQNGATTADTLVNLALIHIDLDPDFVLVYHGTNDLESSYAPGFRSDYSHRRRNIAEIPPVFETLPRWLDYSAMFVLTRNVFLGNRAHGDLWSRYTRRTGYDFEHGPFGLDTFRRNLRHIIAIARANGAKVVLGTFQYHKEWAVENMSHQFATAWGEALRAQNEIIREIGRTEPDVFIADVATAFEPSSEYMWDFCHFTPRGNALIADVYYETLANAGVSASDP